MKKYLIAVVAVLGFALVGSGPSRAEAQGLHFHAGGLHIDVGRPHGSYYGGRPHGSYYGKYRHKSYRGGWGRHHHGRRYWHDTSHYDYYPGMLVPHGDHLHYIPGHYHFHRDGHWH